MKKRSKKIIVISVIVVIAAAAVFFYQNAAGSAAQAAKSDLQPSFDTVTQGNIELSVSASGNLESAETVTIKAESDLSLADVLIEEGDTIDEGQEIATLDTEGMQEYSEELKQQILTLQTDIDTTNNVTTTLSIKSTVDGWVKNVVLDDDEYIEDAMDAYGYVALVATEERELINASDSELQEGESVRVKCEGYWHNGIVTSEQGVLYVSIDTIKRTIGADAIVYDTDGNELFTGQIELAEFVPILSSNGIITDVRFSEDEEIEQGEIIYRASQYSLEVQDMYEELTDLKEQYELALTLIEAGEVTAPFAGVVTSMEIKDGQYFEADSVLMSVESTDAWVAAVAVDELDIHSIADGQSAKVTLDSMPNEEFTGTVSGISDKGEASGGITTYDVEISLEDNDGFKLAMTLNSEIVADEAQDVLLVPVGDVRTANTQNYVMVAVERSEEEKSKIQQLIDDNDFNVLTEYLGADAETLNIKMLPNPSELLYAEVRAVEIGLQDAFYAEVKSGLQLGEKVVKTQTNSSNSNIMDKFKMSGMPMGGMSGMTGKQIQNRLR